MIACRDACTRAEFQYAKRLYSAGPALRLSLALPTDVRSWDLQWTQRGCRL
jgi:hypothetical protein